LKTLFERSWFPEAAAIGSSLLYLAFEFRHALFIGDSTLSHDNLFWYFPVFHYFAEGLMAGEFRLWNPLSHGGEPLLGSYLQLRLFDPVPMLVVLVGKFFTTDTVVLFNWDRFIRVSIAAFGAYFLLRPYAKFTSVRVGLALVLILGPITLSGLRQNGIIDQYYLAPLIMLYLLRILEYGDWRWRNWILLGSLIAVNFQSYFFVGASILIFFLLLGFIAFRRDKLIAVFSTRSNWKKIAFTVFLLMLSSGPMLYLLFNIGDFYAIARNVPGNWQELPPRGGPFSFDLGPQSTPISSVIMPYGIIELTGTFSRFIDFLGLLAPVKAFFPGGSEGYLYIGSFIAPIAIYGMAGGAHPQKRIWAILCISFFLLILGPKGGIYWFLYQFFPPIWLIRHTNQFANFFLLFFCFFFVIGANRIVERLTASRLASRINDKIILTSSYKGILISAVSTLVGAVGIVVGGYEILNKAPKAVGSFPIEVPILLSVVIAILFLSRFMRPLGILVSIVSGFSILALLLTNSPNSLAIYLLVHLGFPICIIFVMRFWKSMPLAWGYITLLSLLAMDLTGAINEKRWIWNQISPKNYLQVATAPSMGELPERHAYAHIGWYPIHLTQPIRYVELLTGQMSMMDQPRDYPNRSTQQMSLDELLQKKRWNSFLMMQNYSNLIHTGLSPAILKNIFATNRPVVRFREHATVTAYFVNQIKELPIEQALNQLENTVFISESTNVNTGPVRPLSDSTPLPAFNYQTVMSRPGEFVLKVNAPKDGWLYVADGYHRDWKAWIGVNETKIYRANGNFKAIRIFAGNHLVKFDYQPWSLIAGIAAFYLVVLIGAATALFTLLCGARSFNESTASL